tara:strand:+ start:474 stop:869 length:396 start_codon:yes stop_codon:yes gene_type:complete
MIDVKAAAERLSNAPEDYTATQQNLDMWTVVVAYLDEHPADDDEPVTVSVNLNYRCTVVLTEHGNGVLHDHYNELRPLHPNINFDWFPTAGERRGEFQLWCLMNIFGSRMHPGCDQLFVGNTIKLQCAPEA